MFLSGQHLVADAQLTRAHDTAPGATGTRSPAGAPGCYSTALITPSGVTLTTDPVGQFPLFITERGGDVWFGTSAADIAKHIGAPLDRISLTVAIGCQEISELTHGASMYAGIREIPPGRILSIGRSGIQEREHDAIKPDSETTQTDAAERLRLFLSNAVRARVAMPEQVTADLSGGLDSTSLALLALEYTDELPLLTYVNPVAPVTDDLEHARHHVRTATNLRQHLVRAGPDDLPYTTLGPVGELPHGSLTSTGALRARLRRAAELGSRVHLVGEGGDVVVGAPVAYLADLARRGDLARRWRYCVAGARLRARSPLVLFRRAVRLAGTTRRRALTALAAELESGDATPTEAWEQDRIAYWPRPHPRWLTRPARKPLAEHLRDVAGQLVADDDTGVGDSVTAAWVRQQALTLHTVRQVGAEFGIDVHAPFMDTEVVRACLSLPAYRRADPTLPKPLLRAALAGRVPDAVLARTTKGDYTRDAYLGVRRAAPALRRLLSEPVAADLGILEPGPVRDVLERAVQGMPTPWGALNQVIAVETWLREREEGRP
jgi:asparagine synthase (glutamine-hydrolysing)